MVQALANGLPSMADLAMVASEIPPPEPTPPAPAPAAAPAAASISQPGLFSPDISVRVILSSELWRPKDPPTKAYIYQSMTLLRGWVPISVLMSNARQFRRALQKVMPHAAPPQVRV